MSIKIQKFAEAAMRKSKAEAAETRKRIVAAAAAEFRKNGIVATGLADLMKAAGLTHGGFYKHFESKDQLVAEACAEAGRELSEKVAANTAKGSAVSSYLSTRHRDNPADGCPLAALGPELARCDEKTRAVATAGFERLVGILAGQFGKLAARGSPAACPGVGLDHDRRPGDGADGDRPRAVGGDPPGGGGEHHRGVIEKGVT